MTGSTAAILPAPFTMEEKVTASIAMQDTDDHALMERIAVGDEKAFRMLVERHQHGVVGTAAKMLGDHSDAEDIAQQVFLRIWRHAKRYRPDAKFTTYLFTVTRNLVFNESRRRSRHKEVSSDALQESTGKVMEEASGYQPDEELLQQELRDAIDKAISKLPENQRMAVVLRRYQQLPYEEIGEVLDLSVPAVKSLLFRARTTLRDELSPYIGH